MNLKQTAFAVFAAAAVATGATAVTTTQADAGYGYKVKFKHHGFYGHHFYKPKIYVAHYCFWKPVKVWTHYGPVWVNKKVCH